MSVRVVVVLVLCGAWFAGCAAAARTGAVAAKPPAPVSRVDVVVAEAVPMAVSWDERPGPDGVRVRVTMFRTDLPQPVIGEGSLEFLLFAGQAGGIDPTSAEPFRSWRFSCQELRPSLARSIVGWGYSVSLGWGDRPPRTPTVSLFVRYIPLQGDPVWSKPVSIAVSAQ